MVFQTSPRLLFSTSRARITLHVFKFYVYTLNTPRVSPLHITHLPPTPVLSFSLLHQQKRHHQSRAQADPPLPLYDTSIMSTTSLPILPDPNDGLGGYGLPSIIRSIQKTGFRKWGFRIYRFTYDDEDAWSHYLRNLETELSKGLQGTGSDYMLTPYHEWDIVEDRDSLDGAAKAEVRTRFRRWSEGRSAERDGPGADHELVAQAGLVARFEA